MAHLSCTRAEAFAKVGTRVRARVAFAGIPKGALGTILRVDHVIDGSEVAVAWGRAARRPPWMTWATKTWLRNVIRVYHQAYPPRDGALATSPLPSLAGSTGRMQRRDPLAAPTRACALSMNR